MCRRGGVREREKGVSVVFASICFFFAMKRVQASSVLSVNFIIECVSSADE
jgi:hypothetical protein